MTPPREERLAGAAEVWAPGAAEMGRIDGEAIERGLTQERTLIEAAGRELAHRLAAAYREGPVCGLVGSGHNGADAMVALRTLKAWGREVRGIRCGSRLPEPDVRAGWPLELESPDSFSGSPPRDGVLLDGILGTGASGAPREPQAVLIESANALGLPIVSADVPSGADPTTGEVPGACVRADLTVCFGWPKIGLLRHPARGHAGRIEVVEIGFPPPESGRPPAAARIITGRWAADLLRPRPPDAHKGTAGYLLLVAGASGMAGAAVLAARAAYRAGAGIVRILSHPAHREIIHGSVPGAVFASWDEPFEDHLAWADALAIGPGLGRAEGRRALVEALLEERGERRAVVDADGLNAFAGDADRLADRLGVDDVITPHPGELARLLGDGSETLPWETARDVAARMGCTVVLKGNPTVVGVPGEPARVAGSGGPAFAVGGTGDVLTGAIGALLSAGYPGPDAATVALELTGRAGERRDGGDVGLVAEDLPEGIPEARRTLESPAREPTGAVRFVLPAPDAPVR